jgi:hypothetical protein
MQEYLQFVIIIGSFMVFFIIMLNCNMVLNNETLQYYNGNIEEKRLLLNNIDSDEEIVNDENLEIIEPKNSINNRKQAEKKIDLNYMNKLV